MSLIKVTQENFETDVLKASKPVLLDFYADWCGPCRMISPIIKAIGEEYDDYIVAQINVEAEPELSEKFDVVSIPTLVVIKDGKVAGQALGYRSKEDILELLMDEFSLSREEAQNKLSE